MALDAGTVKATLGADFRPQGFIAFDAAMKKSGRNVQGFEGALARSVTRSSSALRSLGTVAGVGTAGAFAVLGVGVAKSVKEFANYNREMQTVKAVSKASAREMNALERETKRIGLTTKFSATQAAQGSVELVKAGMSVKQVIGGGLKTALSLAAAGDLELADAAKYTANAMNLFGIEAKGAGKIADGLAKAAVDTTADVSDFGMALTQGGSAAKTAGLSFTDTMVILEALAKAGIKNSDAGTSMKAALIQLIKPTAKQAELQKKLGLDFVGANGKMKDATQISKQLHDATSGMTDAQRTATFATLAGTDGYRTLAAIYSAGPKLLKEYEAGLAKSGTAAQVAGDRQKGLAGSLDKAKASFQTALVIVGQQVAPVVERLATGFSQMIAVAAGSGQLGDIGRQLGDGLQMAVDAGQGFVAVLQGMLAAGAPAAAVIQMLAGALSALPAEAAGGALMGIVTALIAMRAAAFIAPMLSAVATGIQLVMLAAKTGELMALPGLFMSMANPVALLVAGSAAAGAGLALLATRETEAEAAARAAAAAKRELAAAIRGLKAAEDDAAGKAIDADQAKLNYEEAQAREKATRGTKEHRQATIDLRRAKNDLAKADEAVATADKKLGEQQVVTRKEASERLKTAREELDVAKQRAAQAEANRPYGGQGAQASDLANLTAKQRAYNDALADNAVAQQKAAIAGLNAQRMAAGKDRISNANRAGVAAFMQATASMPKSITTKILMSGDQKAVSQIGKIALSLNGIVPQKKIQAILAGDTSVKAKLAALRREANRQDEKVINAILKGGGTAQQKLKALQALKIPDKTFTVQAVKLGPFSFDVVVTKTVKTKGNAIGASPGRAIKDKDGLALVGEEHPREAVISGKTGDGYFTNGPMLDRLGPHDYVIPTDNRYRGRALGLFGQLANDLGIPGFGTGRKGRAAGKKKGSDFPIPQKYQRLALSDSLDELRSDMDNAKSKADSLKGKKGKKSERQEWINKFKRRERIYMQAAKFDKSIRGQEDLVEIAENDMALAAKRQDSGLYTKGKKDRKRALQQLQKWLERAVAKAPNGSAFKRELQKRLGQKLLALEEEGPAYGDPSDYISDAEQTRLDELDAELARAELTTNTIDDDRSALSAIEQLRAQIYGRVTGANAGPTVIADAARALKTARDNLAGLTTSAAPDLQAQIEQEKARTAAAQKDADANAAALRAFGGPGDISSGAKSAYAAAGGPQITINTLHPGDPQTLAAVAGATAAGIGAQGYVPRSRVRTGL